MIPLFDFIFKYYRAPLSLTTLLINKCTCSLFNTDYISSLIRDLWYRTLWRKTLFLRTAFLGLDHQPSYHFSSLFILFVLEHLIIQRMKLLTSVKCQGSCGPRSTIESARWTLDINALRLTELIKIFSFACRKFSRFQKYKIVLNRGKLCSGYDIYQMHI